jgi:hypothetical protein
VLKKVSGYRGGRKKLQKYLSLANFYFKRLLAAEIARGNNRERRYTHLGGVSPEAFEAASLSGWKVSLYRGKSILSVGTV